MSKAFDAGVQAMNREEFMLAEEKLTAALQEEPNNAYAMIYLQYVRVRRARMFRRYKLMYTALSLAPEDPTVLRFAAHTMFAARRTREGLHFLARARAADPLSAEIHAVFAEVYLGQRKRAECEAALKESLRLNPKHGRALKVRGKFEEIYYDPKKAAETARMRLRKSPESKDAHLQSGRACLALGDVPQAYWHFREALRLSPNSEEARDALAEALRQRFPLYNWLYRLSLRTKRFRVPFAGAFIYFGIRIVAWTASDPSIPAQLRSLMIGLLATCGVVIVLIVLPLPIVNFAVRFHPVGRYAQTKIEKQENGFLLCLGISSLLDLCLWPRIHAESVFMFLCLEGVFLLLLGLESMMSTRSKNSRGALLAVIVASWIILRALSIYGAVVGDVH